MLRFWSEAKPLRDRLHRHDFLRLDALGFGGPSTTCNIGFQNILATIYQTLGIAPSTTPPNFNGRPNYVLEDREPIRDW